MMLNINDDRYCEAPTLVALEDALLGIAPEEFAILNVSEQHYLQTYRNEDDTFVLEYRAGSPEAHFESVEPIDNLAQLVRVFSLYLQEDSAWKSLIDWQPVKFDDTEFLHEDNAYLIAGEIYSKVPFGSESYPGRFNELLCPECGASSGQFHEPGCTREQCPRCGKSNDGCGCT